MKAILFTILGIFLLGTIVVFAYIYNEKPIQEGEVIIKQNISLLFYDEDTNQQVRTGYQLTLGESRELYLDGNTTQSDFSFVEIPTNTTFYIFNNNLDNQSYYTTRYSAVSVETNGNQVLRAQVPLTKYGNLTITQDQKISFDNNNVYLTLESPGTFRYVTLCYQWSPNIVSVSNPDFEQLSSEAIPERLKNKVVKCYITRQSIIKNTLKVRVAYYTLAQVRPDDYIRVYILDGDVRYYSINGPNSFILEDQEGHDIGSQDIEYIIK